MKNRQFFVKFKLAFLLLHLLLVPQAQALVNQPDEESIRAAMVIGILRYTQLPLVESDNEIQVCTLGAPFVEEKLSLNLSGLRVSHKRLKLNKFETTIDASVKCHVVISGEKFKTEALANYLEQAKQKQLVVCDGCASGLKYSAIELFKRNNGIGFKVNLDLAKQNNVIFSSSLLELASEIKGRKK